MTAGARVGDGAKVVRKIVSISTEVSHRCRRPDAGSYCDLSHQGQELIATTSNIDSDGFGWGAGPWEEAGVGTVDGEAGVHLTKTPQHLPPSIPMKFLF
jgi:hypothetical protein